jgi:hypothetical protein
MSVDTWEGDPDVLGSPAMADVEDGTSLRGRVFSTGSSGGGFNEGQESFVGTNVDDAPADEDGHDGARDSTDDPVGAAAPIRYASGSATVESTAEASGGPLRGVRVVVVHVKPRLEDAVRVEDVVLRELEALELQAGLGCEFIMAEQGMSVFV